MSAWQFILRSLSHHARSHLAVLLGVAVATAVLTGALLVGDSMTGSLRDLTLDRLGRIDQVLVAPGFFREQLATELAADPEFQQHYADALPAILLPRATFERPGGNIAGGATIVACDHRFWSFDRGTLAPPPELKPDEVILNEPLASDLAVAVGDEVLVRLPKVANIPADSALGRKKELVESIRVTVSAIVPAEGLGRFSLQASQHLPRTAWTRLATLQMPLELLPKRSAAGGSEADADAAVREPLVNAIFVAGRDAERPSDAAANEALTKALRPTLTDLGLNLDRVRMTYSDEAGGEEKTAFEYFRLSSSRMMIGTAADNAVEQSLATYQPQPVLTYLANTISKIAPDGSPLPSPAPPLRAEIPYSTIVAVDSLPVLGPLFDADGQPLDLADNEIVLNSWTAEQLGAQPGDTIRIAFFEPEAAHGATRETHADFRLRAIAPLIKPAEKYDHERAARYTSKPGPANDPYLTPVVKGLTDRASLADWDAPFDYDSRRIKPPDEDYWDFYRATPKAFVSLATGRKLWGSRFGQTTGYRIAVQPNVSIDVLAEKYLSQLQRDRTALDLVFQPVKAQGLMAAGGTVPFNGLFLGFSMFLIAAAVMLTALLFRLAIERRAAEIGILSATGIPRGAITWWLGCEGLLVATAGAALGTAGGVAYAWLMLAGLRTLWLDAVTTPFLTLHVGWISLAIGLVTGVVIAGLVIWQALRDLAGVAPRTLLAGQTADAMTTNGRHFGLIVTGPLLAAALLLVLLATRLGGEAQAGAFFGAGAALLAAALVAVWDRLNSAGASANPVISLALLALSNASRAPGRTTLTVGLVAAASFLIIAISAFHLEPSDAGAGGFDLVAESDQPVYQDLNQPAVRKTAGISTADDALFAASRVFALRSQAGDDASCLNLFQPARPRALGISPALVAWFDTPEAGSFAWAGSAAESDAELANPWRVLQQSSTAGGAIPVVLDKNTAMYSLHLYGGVGEEFELPGDDGPPVKYRVAGLLADSILQGYLLMSEEHLLRLYPEVTGYRYFLVRTPSPSDAQSTFGLRLRLAASGVSLRDNGSSAAVAARGWVKSSLERALRDQGFLATSTRERLTALLAVQNTYLSTFRSLGALGLLLGACGLAAVQLRNVLERRGELALLRAEGFTERRLMTLVLIETGAVLLAGLGVGVFAALLAVSPQLIAGSAAVPVGVLSLTLGLVLLAGLLTTYFAVGQTLSEPLLPALRGE